MNTCSATGKIYLSALATNAIKNNSINGIDVVNEARLEVNNFVTNVNVNIEFNIKDIEIEVKATVSSDKHIDLEDKAVSAVSISALKIYKICKVIDKSIKITDIKLEV